MTSPRSTPPPRISPLPRLESYAHYSATQEKLWEGHDPVRLAAREASIRARMVARARARARAEGEVKSGDGGEGLLDEFGRMVLASSRGGVDGSPRAVECRIETPTTRGLLKSPIIASSATLDPHATRAPLSGTTPRSTDEGSARSRMKRQPSALEIKYSPGSASPTARGTSGGSVRASVVTGEASRESGYLASPAPVGTPEPRILRSLSPSFLAPHHWAPASPLAKYYHGLAGREGVLASGKPWDGEEEFRRLSMYLVDPYQRSPEASPVSASKAMGVEERGEGVRGERQSGGRGSGRGLWKGVNALCDDGGSRRTETRSPSVPDTLLHHSSSPDPTISHASHHASSTTHSSTQPFESRSPRQPHGDMQRINHRSTSLRSPPPRSLAFGWDTQPLPLLPVEPPRKLDISRRMTGSCKSPSNVVSICSQGPSTTAGTSSHSRSQSDDSDASSTSSTRDVGAVWNTLAGFPAPPVRLTVARPADEVAGGNRLCGIDYAQGDQGSEYLTDRRPSASSTATAVSDCSTITFDNETRMTTSYDEKGSRRRDSVPSLSLVRTASYGSAGPKTPLLDSHDDYATARGNGCEEDYFGIPAKNPQETIQNRASLGVGMHISGMLTHSSGARSSSETPLPSATLLNSPSAMVPLVAKNQRATSPNSVARLVPPTGDMSDWGELEILDSDR